MAGVAEHGEPLVDDPGRVGEVRPSPTIDVRSSWGRQPDIGVDVLGVRDLLEGERSKQPQALPT